MTPNLPALCDEAIRDLGEVRSIDEVLKIRDVMEAARVYAAKHKLAQDVQDKIMRIIVLAERKVGMEIIAAVERGELAKQGRPKNVRDADVSVPTLEEIGLPRQRVAEYRELAALSDEEFEETIDGATRRGEPLTRALFRQTVKAKEGPWSPPHVIAFQKWLLRGTAVVGDFLDHRELMSLAARYRVPIDRQRVVEIVAFLAALQAGLDADS